MWDVASLRPWLITSRRNPMRTAPHSLAIANAALVLAAVPAFADAIEEALLER